MLNVFRKNLITLFLLASVLLMAGCELDTQDQPEPERLVTVNLTGLPPVSQLKSTASATENRVDKLVFYGVDATGDFVDKFPIPISDAPAASYTLTISKRIKTLYAVANPTPALEVANPTASQLQDLTVDYTSKPQSPFLMSGSGEISNSSESNSSVSIALVRSVAKIEIIGKNDFVVTGVTVTSTTNAGYVLPRSPLAVPTGATAYATTLDHVIYVAENTGGNTTLTVKGTYDNKTATKTITLDLPIERNKHYTISISPGSAGGTQYGVTVANWYDATVAQTETVQHPYKNGIKILAIGNSYSENSMQYLFDLLVQSGVAASGIKLVSAYISGSALHIHWWSLIPDEQNDPNYFGVPIPTERYSRVTFYVNGLADYDYVPAPGLDPPFRYWSLFELVTQDKWDLITLQQNSDNSGLPATYDPYLGNLLNYVKGIQTNPKCKFAWHMTWAWGSDYFVYSSPWSVYGNQAGMYSAICNTVHAKIVPRLKPGGNDFDFIIPSGIAIQNARALFGDILNAPYPLKANGQPERDQNNNIIHDNSHLNGLGSYVAGIAWVKAIIGSSLTNLTPYTAAVTKYENPARPITAAEIDKAVNAVNAAYDIISASPYLNP